MAKRVKLINRLTKYFIRSTALPFLLIVLLSGSIFQSYYNWHILTLTDGYTKSMAQNISRYIKDLEQVIILPFFDDEVMALLNKFSKQDNINFSDQIMFNNEFGNLISSIRYVRNDFYSAIIVSGNKTIYASSNFTTAEPALNHNWEKEVWYKKALEANGKIIYIPPHITDYYNPKDDKLKISVVCSINNLITRKPYAVIKIDILPESFINLFDTLDFIVPFNLYMSDENNNIIFCYPSNATMLERLDIREEGGQKHPGTINETLSNHIKQKIPGTPYTLNILLDKTVVFAYTLLIYVAGVLLYLLAFIIALLLNRRLTKRISEPINAINITLRAVEKGNFTIRYESQPGWELEEIGVSLNHMIEDLKETIEKKYIAELAKEKAENKALLSQISPHFLFNTLNSMIAMLYDGKFEQMEKALYNLSDLLHYVLRKDDFSRIEEELSFLNAYLMLQKERFTDRLSFSIEAEKETLSALIPRLLLQPFVENSVIHGMEPISNFKCFIAINTSIKDGKILIRIKDDGAGFDLNKTDISSSIGISNSINRVRIMDPESSISITSAEGQGCTIDISMKIQKEKNENTHC